MDIEKSSANERRACLYRHLPPPRQTDGRQVAEDRPVCRGGNGTGRRDCYWLYVVTSCKSQPCLQAPIKNPARFPWHEACLPRRMALRRRQVKKVDHYYLSVDALTQPMHVKERPEIYGDGEL